VHLHYQAAYSGYQHHGLPQGGGTDEGGYRGGAGAGQAVPQRHRSHRRCGVHGGLEKRGPEPPAGPTAPGGAFRERSDGRTAGQRIGHRGDCLGQRRQPLAIHEDRVGPAGHQADHRPRPHLTLGHHVQRLHRTERDQVQPGQVVAHHQDSDARRSEPVAAGDCQLDPQRLEQRPRPCSQRPLPVCGLKLGERDRQRRPGQEHCRDGQQPQQPTRPPHHGHRVGRWETARTTRRHGHPWMQGAHLRWPETWPGRWPRK
jgi:hypothetical protein